MKSNHKIVAGAVALASLMLAGGGGYVSLEGREKEPYKDIGGVWTDCYGNTHNVKATLIRSENECRELLGKEGEKLAIAIWDKVGGKISQATLASYVSFSYNIGLSAFNSSTLLKLHLNGDYASACKEMFKWVYVKRQYVHGLYNRRKIEYAVCMRGVPQNV